MVPIRCYLTASDPLDGPVPPPPSENIVSLKSVRDISAELARH